MNKSFTVYSHVNKRNGATYVGITKRKPEVRWAKGFGYKKTPYFWRAIVKYGWDGFYHNILYVNLSKEAALEIEARLIAYYKGLNMSYNISDGNDYIGKIRSKPIDVYSKSGRFIVKCSSMTEASK